VQTHTGTADTALRFAGQYEDSTGLIYMRARFYDPATTQFLTRDPAAVDTGTPYSYADNNPTNWSDPSGLCNILSIGKHSCVRSASNAAWHTTRFVATLPETVPALAVDKLTGADCDWNGKNMIFICYGGPTVLGAPATTFGAVINTHLTRDQFAAANCGRLLAHETKHTDQWAILGAFDFLLTDGAASGVSEAGWGDNAHNVLEMWAGLNDGGYTPCC
jgi:RHS repeat-associated protein